jgi:alkanesulfonate monooxygenase SsuD/methylene tetrahydromethanopterin reductase-like flavin-dependent oxidoreductase (luciferase family)
MSIPDAGEMRICTTISLPTIRGPLPLAKTLTSLDALADGRLVAGLGPGSSKRDYAAVGVPFEERWPRFDESVQMLRRLFHGEEPVDGAHYAGAAVASELQPRPSEPIPIWIGSWGSDAGLRRVARLADGWLASGYNTTPEDFGVARTGLDEELERQGKTPSEFENGLATMWLWITDDRSEAERMLDDVLGPTVKRDADYLRPRVCVGSADHCLDLLSRYAEAGLERVFLWPLNDDARQLELAAEALAPLLAP